jgi:hypothetical protein
MTTAEIYRVELMRAAFGEKWRETKVADLHRLNQYAERLAESARQRLWHRRHHVRGAGKQRPGPLARHLAQHLPQQSAGLPAARRHLRHLDDAMTQCEYLPPLAAYVVVCLAAPGLFAIALSIIDRRRSIRRMHRNWRAE